MKTLASAYAVLQESFVTQPDGAALINWAIKGMLRGVDPDAGEYFTKEEFDEFRPQRKPGLAAAGLEIRVKNEQLLLAPLEGGPAVDAGVQFGDQLHAVDGQRIRGLPLHELLKRIDGPEGTVVTLTVFRESTLAVLSLPVVRREFVPPGPTLSRPGPGVAMLRIPAFRAATLSDAVEALRAAWQSERYAGLILDLRGCSGGLLDPSIALAAMFLPTDAVVAVSIGNSPSASRTFKARKADYWRGLEADPLDRLPRPIRELPLAVLVDESTAAAGEIVAAALKDHQRARLFGRKTFGRGSIQTITPIAQSGAIKYTSAYWTTPSGERIHGAGVLPDTVTPDGQSALQQALGALKANGGRP